MNPLRLYLLSIALVIVNGNVTLAAQDIPDSLTRKLASVTDDSTRAITWLEIGESMEASHPEEAMKYYQQSLALGKQINNDRVILSSFVDVGICYINLNEMDSAIISFKRGITYAEKLQDTIRVVRLLANIGNAHLHKKDRAQAIEYYLRSARRWEMIRDQSYLPALYSNINALLDEQQEHTRALQFGLKAVALAKHIRDEFSVVNALVNLSTTYGHLGQHDKELALLTEALPLAKQNKNAEQIAAVYQNQGEYYSRRHEYATALQLFLESYTYVGQLGNPYHLSEISTVLAQAYYKTGDLVKAHQFIVRAEHLADEVGERTKLKEIWLTRAEIEQTSGNFKLASEYYAKTIQLSDSLFTVETSEKVAEAEAQYQNERKQKEIVQLEKDKALQAFSISRKSTLNNILIGSLAMILLLGILLFRNFRTRQLLAQQQDVLQQQRIRELEKDKKLVAVDALLQGQEAERSRLAKDLHDGLGGLLSGVKFSLSNMKENVIITPDNLAAFTRSIDMIDSAIHELRRVAHNMMPEMLVRFGLDEALKEYCSTLHATKLIAVTYQSFGMTARIDSSKEIILYRIVQELLNNTLKHAEATSILVQLVKDSDRLSVLVEDNGKGFDTTLLDKQSGSGWTNIRSRVDYLQGRLDLHVDPGKGTSVSIDIRLS